MVITLGARIGRVRGALTAASSVEHTFMMVLDHPMLATRRPTGGHGVRAAWSSALARTTETSLERSSGTLSCLSARPPDLATATAAQPEVACVRPSIVPFLHSKRTAVTRSPGSRYGSVMDDRSFCGRFEHTSRGTTHTRKNTQTANGAPHAPFQVL